MVLAALREAIEGLPDVLDGDELREAYALADQLQARLTVAARRFESDRGHELDAAQSLASWLRGFAGRAPGEAGRIAAHGRRLGELPVTRGLWLSGGLTSAQIAIMLRYVTLRRLPVFVTYEPAIAPHLVGADLEETEAAMARFAAIADALLGDPDPSDEPERTLHLSATLGGRHEGTLSLDNEGGTTLTAALRIFERRNEPGETRRRAERRGDALVDLCRWALDHHGTIEPAASGRERPHVNVVVDLSEVLAGRGGQIVGGAPLDGPTIRRLLCDANIHRLVTDGPSVILDYGRATRTVSPAQWAALVIRDRHCTFQGCDAPADRCEAHHVLSWLDGGETNLKDLRLRCWHHHHLVHQPGWHEKLLPDGTIETTNPHGRLFHSKPPGD